jgi:crotonobetainyl-CoA:carnitine CoA-transferase CaiB-like acyl-CoA transferase
VVSAPLAGLRVLDLTRFVAGSQATATLATLGAEVIKIEVPPGGDPYRVQGTERVGDQSVLFMSLNSGKRSVALDIRAPAAADAIERLLAGSDFLVENARPGSLARYGLDWASVHARHPSIVYGSISGYGDAGPEASRGGFDLILQAESGVMSITGSPDSGPVKVGAPILDVGAGLSCALGLVAAHVERLSTGEGRHVTSSLLEFALAGLGTLAASYFVSGETPGLLGTHSPDLWVRCCGVLGVEELLDDPRFTDNAARVQHRDELTAELERALATRTSAVWLAMLETEGVPAAEVRDIGQVFDGLQPAALGSVQELSHPEAGPYRLVSAPVRIDGEPLAYPCPAPSLGADTRAVLTDAGLSDADVDALVAAGAAIAP